MAVAILAQLVQLRASGTLVDVPAPRAEPAGPVLAGPGLANAGSSGPGPAAGPRQLLQLAEAVDPVCGMTVAADASALPFEHDGVTYYFCCSGCRRAFEENPHSYSEAVLR
jgi:xanthine dehydrogenase accessory factor